MKKEIKNKMDEHIKQILDKPYITSEDYDLLEHELEKIPSSNNWGGPFWIIMMMMFFSGFGGKKDEL